MKFRNIIAITCVALCILFNNSVAYAEARGTKITDIEEVMVEFPHYTLEKDQIAPVPNPSHFGTIDPSEAGNFAGIFAFLRYAGLLGEDEELIFNENVNFFPNSKIDFYYDETILVICWREKIGNSLMTFSEIKIADPSQFRRKLAGDKMNSGSVRYCSEMCRESNAVIAMNADFYSFRNLGVTCYDSIIYRTDQRLDTLFVDKNGDFKFFPRGLNVSQEDLQKFVDDNGIQFSLAFGPILIENGVNVAPDTYPIGEINDTYARASISQVGPLHYLYANVSYGGGTTNTTIKTFTEYLATKNVKQAYTLDGGQTSEMLINNKLMHKVVYNKERAVSDMLYFASAVPNQE